MNRMLRTTLLTTVLLAVAAPVAMADSSTWRERDLDCRSAETNIVQTITVQLPPSMFTTPAIVPFHDVASTAVLVPFWMRVSGGTGDEAWVWVARSKPSATNHADRNVSCTYTDPAGLFIEIEGLLTPAR